MRTYLHAKIHKATVTDANLEYMGSVTIDQDLMERVGIAHYEKVLVVDNTNGARLETYAIPGEPGTGTLCMNGAAAHLVNRGDEVIIMAFETTDHPSEPKQILVDANNRFAKDL